MENVDRAFVAGTHYAAADFVAALPAIPCFDGVGRLADGTLVGFGGLKPPAGALAERVVVPAGYAMPIPHGIAPEIAASLSSAITAMSMQTAGGLQPGETVLIQGGTGVAGRLAIQIARLLDAGRIVATGRDAAALRELEDLGADATIDTAIADDDLVQAFSEQAGAGYDVILDYLWGRPTELLTRALIPASFTLSRPTRLVQIGEAAGRSGSHDGRCVSAGRGLGPRRAADGRRRDDAAQPHRRGVDPHRPPRPATCHHPRRNR
ncbi:zinc-binding alcohol dehydrogenase family protein [Leifsonia shinshuensis]|uniref:zinc-binding alcohol dehydrogenase family protein n=1 Tax=Leifsonia shinshuensis TaxID=150026 RepID=UPI0031E931BF